MSNLHRVLIVHADYPRSVHATVKKICASLDRRSIGYDLHERLKMEFHRDQCATPPAAELNRDAYQLILAVGGDGTFLYAARSFLHWDLPLMGIHAGRLGYLMEIAPRDIERALDRLQAGDYHVSRRLVIEAQVRSAGLDRACFQALNDVVITRGAIARMIEISVMVEGQVLSHYRADGTIVSTPTGSTAYNLSSGGPILAPDVEALVITPICPHTLGVRPVVIGTDKKITFKIQTREGNTILAIDGQEGLDLGNGDEVCISLSPHRVTLFRLDTEDFFTTLREKLGWHK